VKGLQILRFAQNDSRRLMNALEGRKLGVKRLQKLRPLIVQQNLDALLVSKMENYRYLSGFTGSSGWLLISHNQDVLATDFRYIEQARTEAPDFNVTQIKGDLNDWLPRLASEFRWRRLGFEADFVPFAVYHRLGEIIKSKRFKVELIPTTNLVENLRSIKEENELRFIAKAVELTDTVFAQIKSIIKPGITEKEAAWETEKRLRENGSDGIAFDIIVASGANSALPHAKPAERTICPNEPVLIDMGARLDGYCSDFSRTLCFGKPDKTLTKIYDIVLKAQLTAIEGIRTGMKASEADKLARDVIQQAGYGNAFGHGLGHGIGLEVHEFPALGPSSDDLLTDGMVFTVEPGIYISEWGGVRIEDVVSLQEGKATVLTRSEKAMEVIA
jgi:Xaa-Pro aminopeptidase